MPPLQMLLAQSALAEQCSLGAQPGQNLPPQSRSDSAPFLTPSQQVAAWHTSPPSGAPAPASSAVVASTVLASTSPASDAVPPSPDPVAVGLQVLPGATTAFVAHTLLWQSFSAVQVLPAVQGAHPAPPQSSAVSVPLSVPSLQVAA